MPPASAAELKVVDFSPDHRTEALDISGGSECSALLDDDSNFSLVQSSEQSFQVSTDGNSAKSALLLITCKEFEQQFALQYSLSSSDVRNFGTGAEARPPASVGASAETSKAGTGSLSADFSDYSYLPLGYSIRRTIIRDEAFWGRTDSVDVNHDFDAVNVHYGLSVGDEKDGQQKTLRADFGALGSILGGTRTTHADSTEDRQLRAYIAAPVGLRLSDTIDRKHSEERRAERNFFLASQSTEAMIVVSTAQMTAENADVSERSDGTVQMKWNRFGTLRPTVDTAAGCNHGSSCYSQSVGIGAEVQTKWHLAQIRYAPYPHQLSVSHRFGWGLAQELDSSLVMQFEPLPWVTRQSWIASQYGMRSADANSFLHLERRSGPWLQFVEHALPLYQSDSEVSPIEQVSARLGARFESRKVSAGMSLAFGYGRPGASTAMFDLRYFIDQNLARLVERAHKKRISGKVVSESSLTPIAGAVVRLLRNGEELEQQTSDASGNFVFAAVGCCGEVELVADSKGVIASDRVLLAAATVPESTILKIRDKLRVRVQFVLDSNKNGERDETDEVLSLENEIPETGDCIVTVVGGKCRVSDIWIDPQANMELKVNDSLLPFRYRNLKLQIPPGYKPGSDEPIQVLLELNKEASP